MVWMPRKDDADQIRWVEDHQQLEQNFYGEVERFARNDSTVQWRGVFYEVPPYLRRQNFPDRGDLGTAAIDVNAGCSRDLKRRSRREDHGCGRGNKLRRCSDGLRRRRRCGRLTSGA